MSSKVNERPAFGLIEFGREDFSCTSKDGQHTTPYLLLECFRVLGTLQAAGFVVSLFCFGSFFPATETEHVWANYTQIVGSHPKWCFGFKRRLKDIEDSTERPPFGHASMFHNGQVLTLVESERKSSKKICFPIGFVATDQKHRWGRWVIETQSRSENAGPEVEGWIHWGNCLHSFRSIHL